MSLAPHLGFESKSWADEAATIRLDRNPAAYAPGDALTATASLDPRHAAKIRAMELSVVWYTSGKGDEDLHVHEFVRSGRIDATALDATTTLQTRLPTSPLSYAGAIVKVCWAVRVRLFDSSSRQSLVELPVRLGSVAPPEPGVGEPDEMEPPL